MLKSGDEWGIIEILKPFVVPFVLILITVIIFLAMFMAVAADNLQAPAKRIFPGR